VKELNLGRKGRLENRRKAADLRTHAKHKQKVEKEKKRLKRGSRSRSKTLNEG
jgi:hypothetical protein